MAQWQFKNSYLGKNARAAVHPAGNISLRFNSRSSSLLLFIILFITLRVVISALCC